MTDQPSESSPQPRPATGKPAGAESGLPVEPPPTDQFNTFSLADSQPCGMGESSTGFAPSFKTPLRHGTAGQLDLPEVGQSVGDYELLAELGKGAFATVFLARQVSLGRQVALKVSGNRGREAQTLASLEHDHIVRVFAEEVDGDQNLRLMSMQYVNGTTLERVLKILRQLPFSAWNGKAILEAVDSSSQQPAMFDPAALRDRELLWHADYIEAICWIFARLAEALAHAHSQGVLHRDIKPANILINRYGRPMLADFNVALDAERVRGAAGAMFGGTLSYMAPEHLDAFNPEEDLTPEAVDVRSDIYSMGVVLYESLAGALPFDSTPHGERPTELLRLLAGKRRQGAVSPRRKTNIPELLDWTVRRCLDPNPDQRYQTATDLGHALEGCREHHALLKELPRGGMITRAMLRRPFLIGLSLVFLPHVLGSIVNISYNQVRIVDSLNAAQSDAFAQLVLGYNLIVYPFCLWLLCWLIVPLTKVWRSLSGPEVPDNATVTSARGKVLHLPLWTILCACIGWLPGGIFFPWGIHWTAGPLAAEVFVHFLISFTISGLIAMTYSLFAIQYTVTRVLYPRLWVDAYRLRETARSELIRLSRRLAVFQLLAGLIPLVGAIIMVRVAPDQFTPHSYEAFRLLLTALIVLGMVGFYAALSASRTLQQTLTALVGSDAE